MDPEMSPRRSRLPDRGGRDPAARWARAHRPTTVVRGDFEDPVPDEEIVEKFLALTTGPLGAGRARDVVRVVEETERLEDVRDLTGLLAPAS